MNEKHETALETLLRMGAGMANTFFNLSQGADLPAEIRQSMCAQQKEWDAARAILHSPLSPADAGERRKAPAPVTQMTVPQPHVVNATVKAAMLSVIQEHPMGHWTDDQVREVAKRAALAVLGLPPHALATAAEGSEG